MPARPRLPIDATRWPTVGEHFLQDLVRFAHRPGTRSGAGGFIFLHCTAFWSFARPQCHPQLPTQFASWIGDHDMEGAIR